MPEGCLRKSTPPVELALGVMGMVGSEGVEGGMPGIMDNDWLPERGLSEVDPKGDIPEELSGAVSMDVFMFMAFAKMRKKRARLLCLSVLKKLWD